MKGNLQKLTNGKNLLLISISLMLVYQLLYARFSLLFWEPGVHRIIHLGFSFVVLLLATLSSYSATKSARFRLKSIVLIGLILVSIAITVQLVISFPETVGVLFFPPAEAMIAGTIGLILCFFLAWSRYGILFPMVTLVAFVYVIWGPSFLPQSIRPPDISFLRLLSWTAGDIAQEWGTYGALIGYMANYIWLLMMFGAFLQAFGGIRFIRGLGSVVASRLASGPAVLSVVTSGLVGMVTGATTANIAITGSFTIPLMKKYGYSNEQAGAIELAASAGGQILPPIMGVTAFILAEFIGVPYIKIALFAIIPALLYFFTVFMYVQLQAMKALRTPLPSEVAIKKLAFDAPLFIVPFIVLIILLLQGFSLMFVAFWSLLTSMGIGVLLGFFRKEVRIAWGEAKTTIVSGAVAACEVTIIMGLLGALTAIMEMSGLGVTLGYLALEISGGNLLILLLLSALVCLILGTGLPTMAAYVLVATILAPPLTNIGINIIAVHLFIFFFAVFATVTPPIGFGLIVAQKMAGGNYWRTATEAIKAAYVVFFLPFLFVYGPAIILQFEGLTVIDIATQLIRPLILIVSVSFLFNNYVFTKPSIIEMALFILSGALILLSIGWSTFHWLPITAIILLFGGIGNNLRRSKVDLQRSGSAT